MILRPYQSDIVEEVETHWMLGHRVVLVSLATGGGKTPILSRLADHHSGFICGIAHRDKLVEQMSMMFARAGIRHDLICAEKTKKLIARKHVKVLGQCFYVPGARCRIASVQTLDKAKGLEKWAAQVTLWIGDEGHHFQRKNIWGRAVERFTHPQCRGLILTATPGRPDGGGLGRHQSSCADPSCETCNDGFADSMVEGPAMRWLIDEGYLCDYDVLCPPSDLRTDEAPRGADGEFTVNQRRDAERASHIVGDVPKHYVSLASGLSGITFCGTIETAREMVEAYRGLGVTAELITGDTDSGIRDGIFERAEQGLLNQIVAVDVISEGVDIPALQVGSFARLTGSIITWLQQLGRLLRPIYAPGYDLATREGRLAAIAASKKPRALLLDHIGGFLNPDLGPPDKPRLWTLDRREKRAKVDKDDEVPKRACTDPEINCFKPYDRTLRACPFCGYAPEPAARAKPEHVDGDLQLLDPAALAVLQGRIPDIDLTRPEHDARQLAKGAPTIGLNRHWAGYVERRNALVVLRDSMDRWAGRLHAEGRPDWEIQRTFFHRYGVDVVTAQTLDTRDMQLLRHRIDETVNIA